MEIEHSQKKQRRCRLHVCGSAHWQAVANPDGRVFLELLENALNEVEVVIARVAQRISLMPSHIVAIWRLVTTTEGMGWLPGACQMAEGSR